MPPLSATVITFNEADRLGDCLASLAFCDEIVVVDSGSTDATRAIAEAAGARVLVRPFDGFRSQKQFAVEQAAHDWVLCVDADERIGPVLAAAIRTARADGFRGAAGYRFARCSAYFGRFLRHGNAYPDRQMRLFDRRRGGWRGDREIHERATVDGPVRSLDGDLLHLPFRSFEHQLAKGGQYAQMMAGHAHARGRRATLSKLVVAPWWRFWRGYVLRGGFLDGWAGLVYAFVTADNARQKTIRLWLLQNELNAPSVPSTPARDGSAGRDTGP
ncbi:glycosyltransferase family 2 protein [Luteimonas sp. MC1750]|uniref:glycosyltransferase family 2 protein n=1 Tax=Luteimonas sp. MC1750 TaxID=2799326 RepID=UPI0018F0634F|nr:glycosyltransferase family 2 protein [Luteimonas sp. MC1750]MBJ6985031.1 glycosyltransferase family 2 protein [Luteimonas sp. MC1750]QQO05699.1 glycosyltransferase family 2 protein [Luteimonas sp. MC1750]